MSDSAVLHERPSGNRLTEILGVLKKHHITRGLQPVKLREILEDLGPTYVKLGQIMSMRSDILPEAYCRELTRLRTEVRPLPYETIREIMETELGRPVPEVFSAIDPKPLGSASIAQVHPATLKSGERVVVKVQRPHIREIMANDIALMRKAVTLLKFTIGTGDLIDFRMVIDELWKTSQEEMDFLKEAANCDRFRENQKEIVYVTCPLVNHELTTPHLLVMSYIDGVQIDQIPDLSRLGYDMREIGEKTAENYCKQILEDGFFHADPHPGNLRVDGGQIAWLDLGMMGQLSENHKQLSKRAILAVLKNDIYELKNVLLSLGEPKERINHTRLYTDIDDIVSRYLTMDLGSMDLGRLIESLLDLVKAHRIGMPSDITLLGRSIITMEGLLCACSPDVNMFQILSTHMTSLLFQDLDLKKELGRNARQLYLSMGKSLEIPAQLSDLLNITKNGQTKINLELTDSLEMQRIFRNSTGYLTLSILVAALILGACFLCMTNLRPAPLGIPWLSWIGFGLSACLILYLLFRILIRPKK